MGIGDRIKDALNDARESIEDMAESGSNSTNDGADAVQDEMNDVHESITGSGDQMQGRTIEDQGVAGDLGNAAQDRADEIERGMGDARDGLGNRTSI